MKDLTYGQDVVAKLKRPFTKLGILGLEKILYKIRLPGVSRGDYVDRKAVAKAKTDAALSKGLGIAYVHKESFKR
jgi:hypothetical protein